MPKPAFYAATGLLAACVVLPFAMDRLIAPRLPGFASTLVFPLAWVTMELVVSRTNPFGTWGAIAYTQFGNLPLMQLASVTGIAGIAFLVCWFGSVVNWAWDAVWGENNVMVYDEDQAAFIQRAQAVARQEQVYLLMGMANLRLGAARPVEPKTVLVNPSGEVVATYVKNRLVPGWEANTMMRGDGRIPTTDTPYGRLASVICYDLDFPDFIQQVGRASADVLFAPASEPSHTVLGPLHFRMAVFRAIENGVSMVRPARLGVPAAVDPYGRTLAIMDEAVAEQLVLVAQVPVRGVRTIYPRIGDLFAWLCVAGLLGAIGWGIRRSP